VSTETTTPSLSAINPLIAYEDQPEETAENVRNVLTFMAFAFRDGINLGSNINTSDGAGLILDACASALDFHLNQSGAK
jgi:hypothetical protein